jgi:hypothetical protein
MSNVRRTIWVGLWISGVSIALLLALVPQKYIPEQVAPFLMAKGSFDGKPIGLTPKGKKSLVSFRMNQGVCRVSLKQGAELKELFSIDKGQVNCQISAAADGTFILDPQSNEGNYDVVIGPWWHPLSPRVRRIVFLSLALLGLIMAPIFTGRLGLYAKNLGIRRRCFLALVIALSGLILYPAAHEGGHMIVGTLFGATPDWDGAALTSLSGAEPHSSFKFLPATAVPFTTAGGTIVPTLIAVLLLALWRFIHKHVWWHVSAMLVVISVHFFSCTLGCLFELYQNTHMDAISAHFGLTGPIRIALSLSPLFVAIAAYIWIGMKLRESEFGKDQSGKSGMEERG